MKNNTFSVFIILLVVTVSSEWKDEHLEFSGDLKKEKKIAKRGQIFCNIAVCCSAVVHE